MSLPETELTMHRLRPHWGYVTVLDSPVDEEQRASGLIVPHGHEQDAGTLRRGVVLHCSELDRYGMENDNVLAPGTVVYFRTCHRVLDVLVVARSDILAYLNEGEE